MSNAKDSKTIGMFQEESPSLESYWRSIILFGKNVASYKFALAKALLEIAPTGKTEVTLEDLAEPYSRNICEHLKTAPRQVTSNGSKFIDACKDYNSEKIIKQALIDNTVKRGFNNVIDAFHVVNSDNIPIDFFEKDYTHGSKKIVLTDYMFKLLETPYADNFGAETESRWNLVETAWELGVSRNLLNVEYDNADNQLFVADNEFNRKDVTSARGALNGYQKGKCFYCFAEITTNTGDDDLCDVDHFFPHILQPMMPNINLDGVWNLVLACKNCNRGESGKFARAPAIKHLEKLYKRNEYLISSHHPLRETLMNQTGRTEWERRAFLQAMDNRAINYLIQRWDTEQVGEAVF